jgi:xyloglucan-specific exo-beta-1,4-glucanase
MSSSSLISPQTLGCTLLRTAFLFLCALVPLVAAFDGASAVDYVWRSVKIGGGGYMPGIVFSPAERGLAYLRSDMGGAYRWDDKAKRWIPLQDGNPVGNYRGVESIAPDPKNANIVYAAVGTYRNGPSAILRSDDRGGTWDVVAVPFRMGGNEEGRDLGERLAIDPNDTDILYFASRYDGLQKSTDKGRSWSKVITFPLNGLGVPPDHERPHGGLSVVAFDPASGRSGTPSKTIFVGNADPGEHHLYRSDDAGATWTAVPGGPGSNLLPLHAEIDGHGVLYLVYANGLGPYGVSAGGVFRLDTKTGAWTDITPDRTGAPPPYGGLSLDREKQDTLVVATLYREGGDTIWRSTDGGAHWQDVGALSKRDVSETPFLLWGKKEAELGWWMTGLAIDPFDSGHVAYTTGATVYATSDLLAADGNQPILWRPWVNGVEQTAVLALASLPKGPHLLSGFGDIGGFTHLDFEVSPPIQGNPIFTNSDTIDYAGVAPSVVVRSGTFQAHPAKGTRPASLAYSTDYGENWTPLYAPFPPGYRLPAQIGYNFGDSYIDAAITVSADGKTFVVDTQGPVLTRDRGKHWLTITGLSKTGHPVPDRVDAKRFYAVDFDRAVVDVSLDGAAHFKPQHTRGLPKDIVDDEPGKIGNVYGPAREAAWPLMATPGKRGDLWFISHSGLFHSSDGGRSFAEIQGGISVRALAFGKAPPGKSYPALFAIGSEGDLTAIWRSDDVGTHWIRVNDAQHEYGRAFRCIAGDPRVFGRVYVGTDGRGIVFGEPRH